MRVKSVSLASFLTGIFCVCCSADASGSAVPLQAQEFPLSAVKLLDSPFRRAMETDKAYLLRLDPDRLMAGFRREAGLPKKAEPYGGWETIPSEGRYSLAGQALGHYLSALSLMASASGDAECRRRVDAIVDELAACQKAAGTGILCAFPESKQIFAELSAGQIKSDHLFGLNGGYVPLYVTHKVMAGLRDAWLLLGNETARDVLVRMADWLDTVFEPLTDAQIQEILETEHGGIMEVLVDVYAITGDRKHLVLAKRLNHKSLFDPLARSEDCLTGVHANAQIPKVIGMERIYQLTGEPVYGKAARFFWDDVVRTRTFVIGGHGENEFFFAPDAFATQGVTSPTGPETCNTYNMLKLSRRLWLVEPSVAVADYIERALYNHVLSSQEPDHGGFVYFTSMRPGHYRTYSSDTEDFWCCTDTGMESQAKYGEFIYAHSDNRLWVDLLIPSQLDWVEQGVTVRLDTRFPEDGKATLTLSAKEPRKLAIAVRCPGWLKGGSMRLAVNGVAQSIDAKPGSYAVIERTWKTGDRLEVDWPLTLRTEMLPTSKEWISVLWGPVVLAGELGVAGLEDLDFRNTHSYVAQKELPLEEAPVFVGTADGVLAKIKPATGRPLTFRTTGLVQPADVTLAPFYRVHCQRYAIYWRLMDRLEEQIGANKLPANSPTAIRLAPKPFDDMAERRTRPQPTVPSNYTEMPFVETAAGPTLTPEEQQRGYVLFHRPIMEPMYPNTKPLAQERLEQLVAFATPGEFEPLTLGLYPVRDLQNLKVRCSSLTCEAGAIPAAAITVRLVTYWNVGYPSYTSRSTYRRTPELLERVSVHSSPRGECQRYWIEVHVPEAAKPGLYRGTVSVWDDGFDQAVEIPVSFRVLAFTLQKDPAKHYSAYYYVRNRSQYADKPESFVRTASANEYRAMAEYGLDMTPTLYLRSDDGKTVYLPYADELDRMLKAGLKGPVPVTADSVIGRFYRDATPGGEQGSHWNISQLPPPEFYERITAAFKAFESERKAKGWPEFICCPIDEVAAERKEFGAKVYAAVKAAGIRTYATKDPTGGDAAVYRPSIDIWCSQPYSIPYEKIIGQDRYEYWCYPNHNAGEIKDRLVMCKGGRMTYGFGFWRSGYTTLIPWHWSWTPGSDQFDYLRGPQSGCGQRIDDDGEVIPAVYWECFREGADDARYIYTLQQAVFQREDSPDAGCRQAIADARELLQGTWDAINVQQKYLADGMWSSEEFNTRRWLLAEATSELLRYPAVRTGSAPSVLVTNTTSRPTQPETSGIDGAMQAGNIQATDLGGDFAAWSNGTKEGRIEIIAAADHPERKELCWRVHIDHKTDGGEGGQYPVGWPRIARSFREDESDFIDCDYLSLQIRVDSNRDEVADDSTRLGLSLRSRAAPQHLFDTQIDLGDRQRQWIPLRFAIRELIDRTGAGPAAWRSVSQLQLFLSESDYADGTDLTFDIRDVELIRFTAPVIQRVDAPAYIMLPRDRLAIAFDIAGTRSVRPGSHTITLSIASADGRTRTQRQQDLAGERVVVLDTSSLVPGRYNMDLTITAADSTRCSQERRLLEAVDGPLVRP